MPLNSVRNRLVLLFFAITTAAVGSVYLYVVRHSLSSLSQREADRLEATAAEQSERVARAARSAALLRAGCAGSRSTSPRRPTPGSPCSVSRRERRAWLLLVISDSELERTAVEPHAAAANAAETRRAELGGGAWTATRSARRRLPSATRGGRGGRLCSTSLDDVDDSVALIQRQILIAGGIALAAALLAAIAARAHSRRPGRLEEAAEKIAEGNFTEPIPVDSSDEVGQLAMTSTRCRSGSQGSTARARSSSRTPARAAHADLLARGLRRAARARGAGSRIARGVRVGEMRGQIERLTKAHRRSVDLPQPRRRRDRAGRPSWSSCNPRRAGGHEFSSRRRALPRRSSTWRTGQGRRWCRPRSGRASSVSCSNTRSDPYPGRNSDLRHDHAGRDRRARRHRRGGRHRSPHARACVRTLLHRRSVAGPGWGHDARARDADDEACGQSAAAIPSSPSSCRGAQRPRCRRAQREREARSRIPPWAGNLMLGRARTEVVT